MMNRIQYHARRVIWGVNQPRNFGWIVYNVKSSSLHHCHWNFNMMNMVRFINSSDLACHAGAGRFSV